MPTDTEIRGMDGQACTADHAPISDLDIESRIDFERLGNRIMLIGSRSVSSGAMAFPQRAFCPETGARDMERITFGPVGSLYSFSTIHVSATRDAPYTIGYVDFENGIRVMAHVRSTGTLACDQPVVVQADEDTWWVSPAAEVSS